MRLKNLFTAISLTSMILITSAMPVLAAQETDDSSASSSIETLAEESTTELEAVGNESATIRIVLAFKFSDGSLDIWNTGSGVMIDNTHIIVPRSIASPVSDDESYEKLAKEKKSLYTRLGIDLNDYDSFKDSLVIYAVDNNGTYTTAEEERSDEDINLSLLTMEEGDLEYLYSETSEKWAKSMYISGYSSDALQETAESIKTGETAPIKLETTVEITTKPEDNSLTLDENMDLGMLGSGIYSKDDLSLCGVVSGISQNEITVVPASQIIAFVENDPEAQGDDASSDVTLADELANLEDAVKAAKEVDTDGFSEESVATLTDAITNAETVLQDTNATIDEVKEAENTLAEAQANLAEPEEGTSSINMTKLYILGGVAIAIVAGVVVLVLVLRKKKSAPKKQTPIKTTVKKTEKKKKTETASENGYGGEYARESRHKPAGSYDDDDLDGTTVLNNGSEETTVLNSHANINAFLVNESGIRIDITKKEFVIGKEQKKVSYCITGNPTVSRRHALIKASTDGCSIEDLSSRNGTMVNGVCLTAGTPVKLSDGDVITLSDYTLTFHTGD
jgi:hypothetical protein